VRIRRLQHFHFVTSFWDSCMSLAIRTIHQMTKTQWWRWDIEPSTLRYPDHTPLRSSKITTKEPQWCLRWFFSPRSLSSFAVLHENALFCLPVYFPYYRSVQSTNREAQWFNYQVFLYTVISVCLCGPELPWYAQPAQCCVIWYDTVPYYRPITPAVQVDISLINCNWSPSIILLNNRTRWVFSVF
jgi:hypothetical protein